MLWRETFPVGPLQCNCTILADLERQEALIIDPGDDIPKIQALIAEKQLRIVGIVHTHAHIDHIGGAARLVQHCGARAYLHPDDGPMYQLLPIQAQMLGLPPPDPTIPMLPLAEGDSLSFGRYHIGVLHTPGHSPGSVCLVCPAGELCLAGDTLFAGSVGRWDLWGGDEHALRRSIQHKLYSLPKATQIIPGHGPMTSIDQECATNPFVRGH